MPSCHSSYSSSSFLLVFTFLSRFFLIVVVNSLFTHTLKSHFKGSWFNGELQWKGTVHACSCEFPCWSSKSAILNWDLQRGLKRLAINPNGVKCFDLSNPLSRSRFKIADVDDQRGNSHEKEGTISFHCNCPLNQDFSVWEREESQVDDDSFPSTNVIWVCIRYNDNKVGGGENMFISSAAIEAAVVIHY